MFHIIVYNPNYVNADYVDNLVRQLEKMGHEIYVMPHIDKDAQPLYIESSGDENEKIRGIYDSKGISGDKKE